MKSLSLNHKVALIVVSVFVLSAMASLAIQRQMIMPSFLELEESMASRNSDRVMQAMNRELDAVATPVADWSYWSDTYEFVNGEYPEYVEANFSDIGITLGSMNLNFLGIYNANGKVMWASGWDLENEEVVDLGVLSAERLDRTHPLLQLPELESSVKGMLQTSAGPLLVVSKAILTNEKRGPVAGALVMGRFLDQTAFDKLSEQTRIAVNVGTPDTADRAWVTTPGGELLHTDTVATMHEDRWQLRTTLGDLYGEPQLSIVVDTPREVTAHGTSAVNLSLLSLAMTGLVTMIVLWFSLQRVLLKPVSTLTRYAVAVGEDENITRRLNFNRQDEVGTLANTLDEMVDKLQDARQAVIEQSYRSGISEMASGVLHNIGNAITPLNVRLVTVGQELRSAPSADLEQATAELADPATPPERRADLQRFVQLVGMDLLESMSRAGEEIGKAVQQVNTVQEILVDQERASRSERVIESLDVEKLIGESLAALSSDMQSRLRLVLDASVKTCGLVHGTQAAMKQVVTNILVNAAESIEASGSDLASLKISAESEEIDGQRMMHLRFADTGAGIAEECLDQLFIRGFSTKNRHGSGYGLHWSANTLKSLGGWMTAKSEGTGKGACFSVYLSAVESAPSRATGTEG